MTVTFEDDVGLKAIRGIIDGLVGYESSLVLAARQFPLAWTRFTPWVLDCTGHGYTSGQWCNIRSRCWEALPPIPTERHVSAIPGEPAIVVLDRALYVLGGMADAGEESASDAVEKFDLNLGAWIRLSPMLSARMEATAVVGNGCIYVLGGRQWEEPLPVEDSIEQFDLHTETWSRLPSSLVARNAYPAVAVVEARIYIFGGEDNANSDILHAERYDARSCEWEQLLPMPTGLCCGCSVSNNACIYVLCADGAVHLYNTSAATWTQLPLMPTPRFGFSSVVLEGCLYVVGGHNNWMPTCAVEKYDPSEFTPSWSALSSMPVVQPSLPPRIIALEHCIYMGLEDGGILKYDTFSDNWKSLATMNSAPTRGPGRIFAVWRDNIGQHS